MKLDPKQFLRAVLAASALIASGCGSSQNLATVNDWLGLSKPHLTGFAGVRFGETLSRVERELPACTVETSAYGAEMYHCENVSTDLVAYRFVTYEFSPELGMQLAVGGFQSQNAATVLSELERSLGQPDEIRPRAGVSAASLEAVWLMPHEERAAFLGPSARVVMVGPASSSLDHDIALAARASGSR